MPDEQYHADPALSSTGLKKLLISPARFEYDRRHPPEPKEEFDFGRAAHLKVLGAGPKIHVLQYDSRRTNAYKAEVESARLRGETPLLAKDARVVDDMAAQIRHHNIAPFLFSEGDPEVSIFWYEPRFNLRCRARLDWLPSSVGSRTILCDYKTAQSASNRAISKAILNYGYHQSAAWYIDAAQLAGRATADAAFCLVVQEKKAPYLVNVVQIEPDAIRFGRELNHRALEIYQRCTLTQHWPGYENDPVDEIPVVDIPHYAYRDED
jgi:hypothetical protein